MRSKGGRFGRTCQQSVGNIGIAGRPVGNPGFYGLDAVMVADAGAGIGIAVALLGTGDNDGLEVGKGIARIEGACDRIVIAATLDDIAVRNGGTYAVGSGSWAHV